MTDGEMRRFAYFGHFSDAIEGFDKFGGCVAETAREVWGGI